MKWLAEKIEQQGDDGSQYGPFVLEKLTRAQCDDILIHYVAMIPIHGAKYTYYLTRIIRDDPTHVTIIYAIFDKKG